MNNDLENRVLELERRVNKLEKINRRNIIFKVIGFVFLIIVLFVLLYCLGNYYNEILSSF